MRNMIFAALCLSDVAVAACLEDGNDLYRFGYYDDAIEIYTSCIESNRDVAAVYNQRGQAYRAIHQYELAIRDFDQATELSPHEITSYLNRASMQVDRREFELAMGDFEKAIELNPEAVSSYTHRGAAYVAQQQYDFAVRDFNMSVKLDPEYHPAFTARGHMHLARHQYDRAISDFSKAIELLSTKLSEDLYKSTGDWTKGRKVKAENHNSRGIAHGSKHQYARAIRDFTEAIRIDEQYILAYRNRAQTYMDKMLYGRAIQDLNEVIMLSAKDPWAFDRTARIRATNQDQQYRNGTEAVQYALIANELSDFQNDINMNTLAASYAEAGMFAKAVEAQATAISLLSEEDPPNRLLQYKARLALYQSGMPYREILTPVQPVWHVTR